jgi:putative lipoprotein
MKTSFSPGWVALTAALTLLAADVSAQEPSLQDIGRAMQDGRVLPVKPVADSRAKVTGSVTYRQRIALRPGSVVEVSLLDTSRADGLSTTLAHTVIENPGSPPIPFNLEYEPTEIDERMSYSVRATIRYRGRLIFTTDTDYPVLTRGAGSTVDLVLVPVDGPREKPDAPLTNTYWKLTSLGGVACVHASDNREPHLKFVDDGSVISGSGGCNTFTGKFAAQDGALELSSIAVTQRACLEGMDTEREFLKALGSVHRYQIAGDTLQLLHDDEVLLGFEAVYF